MAGTRPSASVPATSWRVRRGSGTGWIWLSGTALAMALLIGAGLIGFIAVHGLGHFWPAPLEQLQLVDGRQLLAEPLARERVPAQQLQEAGLAEDGAVLRSLYRLGNRGAAGPEFLWLREDEILSRQRPLDALALERRSGGPVYGWALSLHQGPGSQQGEALIDALQLALAEQASLQKRIKRLERQELLPLQRSIVDLEARLASGRRHGAEAQAHLATLRQREADLLQARQALRSLAAQPQLLLVDGDGLERRLPLDSIVRATAPNRLGPGETLLEFGSRLRAFLVGFPREANTEGGILPAIFGTVVMVLVMSVMVTPIGVLTAVYLSEYAKDGPLLRLLRVSIYNLAGVPSIVFGIVGLGLFVYVIGGSIDSLLFSGQLPQATFGTPGLFWASLTLALLTLPVVVVSTEEGLSRIPSSLREGAIALGATRWETLSRVLLPLAAPAMMTGLILAIARAAGEVAPLMLVGVVKLAPALPIDGQFPFLHLDRKFMHLGYHIYDVGFQGAQAETARGLVHATALVLVTLVLLLNLAAFAIRNHLRERFRGESL